MATATKKPDAKSDVVLLADLFESLVGRTDDPDVQTLFELLGIPDSIVDRHRRRLASVEHNKALARKLPAFQDSHLLARQNLATSQAAKSALETRIADLTSQLNIARSHNPPTDADIQIISSLSPQLASDENKLLSIDDEITERAREVQASEVNLVASQQALAALGNAANLPLRVQLGLRQSKSTRSTTDERLRTVQELLTLGRASLTIQAKTYNYARGERPATGAMERFYRLGGCGAMFSAPCCFDESGTRLHGDGLLKPFAAEINRMLSEVRVAVSKLEVEESQLLAQAASGFDDDRSAIEAVYVDDLRKELALV